MPGMPQSEASIRQALCRTDMPKGQVTLLKFLYQSGAPVSTEDLAKGIRGGDTGSCTSILGPFSQRINNTPEITGRPGYRAIVKKTSKNGETHYELHEKAREVIDEVPRLLEEFERDMDELREETNPVIEQREFDS
jgi:hypothetical protein